jgi:hypothetical protein
MLLKNSKGKQVYIPTENERAENIKRRIVGERVRTHPYAPQESA